jgi:hypothetical protein
LPLCRDFGEIALQFFKRKTAVLLFALSVVGVCVYMYRYSPYLALVLA